MADRAELAARLRRYAERMEAGEVLEAVGLTADLDEAADELELKWNAPRPSPES